MNTQVQHYKAVDASKEWCRGWLGLLIRWRTIISIGTFKAAVSLLVYLHGNVSVAAGIALLAAWAITSILLIRHYRLQRIASDNALHSICHYVRDRLLNLMEQDGAATYTALFSSFNNDIAMRIASFFRALTNDPGVCCAIRLAEIIDGQECYVTHGRSDGFEAKRAEQTEPLPAHKGLASALMQKGWLGVFVIPSIPVATQGATWWPTRNDELPDVVKLMVAPINAVAGSEKGMLGILYITSKGKDFSPSHTVPVMAIADLLGLAYVLLMWKREVLESQAHGVAKEDHRGQKPAIE